MNKRARKAILLFKENPIAFFVLLFVIRPRYFIAKFINSIKRSICISIFRLSQNEILLNKKSSIPWVVILYNDNYFFRISWRKEIIIHEKNNMEMLGKYEQLRNFLIPFKYKTILWYSIIEMQRRTPIEDNSELFQAADLILENFQLYAKKERNNKYDNFEQIVNGFEVLKELYGNEKILIYENQINELLDQELVVLGPAHGDFHPNNILKDLYGNYYIIDLDCFRQNGICAFDAIYFINQYYADKNKVDWFIQLALFVEKKQDLSAIEKSFLNKYCDISNIQWLLIYFIDRIGQDRKYVDRLSEMPVKEIKEFLNNYDNIESGMIRNGK